MSKVGAVLAAAGLIVALGAGSSAQAASHPTFGMDVSLAPIAGGLEAWVSANFAVETVSFGLLFGAPCTSCAWMNVEKAIAGVMLTAQGTSNFKGVNILFQLREFVAEFHFMLGFFLFTGYFNQHAQVVDVGFELSEGFD